MFKLKLLILDANVVIHLHEFGIWAKLIEKCEVYVARTVVDMEATFFEKDDEKQPIDLSDDIAQQRLQVFEVSLADINRFRAQFDPVYVGELDPGETESLAFLTQSSETFVISSGDAVVFRRLLAHHYLGLAERDRFRPGLAPSPGLRPTSPQKGRG